MIVFFLVLYLKIGVDRPSNSLEFQDYKSFHISIDLKGEMKQLCNLSLHERKKLY